MARAGLSPCPTRLALARALPPPNILLYVPLAPCAAPHASDLENPIGVGGNRDCQVIPTGNASQVGRRTRRRPRISIAGTGRPWQQCQRWTKRGRPMSGAFCTGTSARPAHTHAGTHEPCRLAPRTTPSTPPPPSADYLVPLISKIWWNLLPHPPKDGRQNPSLAPAWSTLPYPLLLITSNPSYPFRTFSHGCTLPAWTSI